MEFNIREIGINDLESLESLVQDLGVSSKSFRYFDSRPFDIIKNHLLTVLVENMKGEEIGYGHLDRENDKIWLGVAVIDRLRGKGIGTSIMKYLLEYAKKAGVEEVWLAVDKNNKSAIIMYHQFGFKTFEVLRESIIMTKNG